jgi:hypothetical protein
MPSARHQVGAYALHKQPDVALSLLQATGVPLPPHDTMHVDSTKLPRNVNDLEADAVITLTRDGSAVASVILEIQLTWREPKTWTWPAYLASQRERRQCDVFLVVICLNTRTAQRCAEPIKLGHPGFVLTPIVIGPRDVPRITDAEQARRSPAAVVLSALAHPRDKAVLRMVPEALSPLNPGTFAGYSRLVEAGLPAASRRFLEVVMRTPYKSEFANKHHAEGYDEGLAEGQAKGLVQAVLSLLVDQQVALSAAARRRIEECRDNNQLLAWLRRAPHVRTAEELFAS